MYIAMKHGNMNPKSCFSPYETGDKSSPQGMKADKLELELELERGLQQPHENRFEV